VLVSITQIAECLKKLGYEELTDIQRESLKHLLKGKHAIIIAPTGSGKTEAAMFPIMLRISAEKVEPIAVIYITPLRALNRDLERRLRLISECFELRVAVRHGDTPGSLRKHIAKDPPHILITTPESLNYILLDDTLRDKLRNIEFVVIDEYREMLESKRGALLLTVLNLLEEIIKKKFVKVALTATLSNIELAVKMLSSGGDVTVIRDPGLKAFKIEVVNPTECASEECKLICNEVDNYKLASRINTILSLAKKHKHILVFTNTRTLAESLNYLLRQLNSIHKFTVEVHHGSLSKQHRENVERAFKERKINILVATSSLELGIDIGHVEHVVQYMSPRQAVRLVQRVGRSRHRIGEVSEGTIIVTDNILHELEARVLTLRTISGDLEEEYVIEKPLDVLAYAIALYVALNPNGVSISEFFETIKKIPLYSNLEFDEYKKVIEFLSYTRVLSVHDSVLKPTRKTKLYLYTTSMIPSSREVNVVDISSDKRIGVLDEEYVVVNISPGDVLILAGRPWRVLNYNDRDAKLYVEPVSIELTEAFIPHWEGENIPVEYSTASKVGEALRSIKAHIRNVENFLPNVTSEILEYVKDLGDDITIYVDYIKDFKIVVINVFGGSRVNNAIRDIVRYVLKSYFPYIRFEIHSTSYAIIIRFIDLIDEHIVEYIVDTIRDLYKYVTPEKIRQIAMSSNTFLWRIYQVGQRFGAISPGTPTSRRLLEAFTETVIGDEALKEVLFRDYDIKSLRQLAERIREGSIQITRRIYNTLQKHHAIILEYVEIPIIKELPTLDKTTYLEKLMQRRVLLICVKCGHTIEGTVKEILSSMKDYLCPKCGYATLTLVKGDIEVELNILDKARRSLKLTSNERRIYEDLVTRSMLLYRFKEKALLALAARGVSTSEAGRILSRVFSGADILEEIYEAEKRFLRAGVFLKK
jgi:ATP-dependent Lhr-like helicase